MEIARYVLAKQENISRVRAVPHRRPAAVGIAQIGICPRAEIDAGKIDLVRFFGPMGLRATVSFIGVTFVKFAPPNFNGRFPTYGPNSY
jgi:hypothetical protein